MYIERIQLNDWKVYANAVFDFPVPTKGKPIVLVGAMNGAGKTSFLEAILFCLYGPLAIELIAERETNMQRGDVGYRRFVARAVNHTSRAQGRTRASVSIIFSDGEERVKVERRWHINPASGLFKEDELFVYEGKAADDIDDLKPIWIPPLVKDRDDYMRGYIAQHILPHNLAPFFFFDGEQIQRLAVREHTEQVRKGLEQLFGLSILRTLQDDLKQLSAKRRTESRKGNSIERLEAVDKDISKLDEQIRELKQERDDLNSAIPALERDLKVIQNTLNTLISGNSVNGEEINKDLHENQLVLDKVTDELHKNILSKSLSLALARDTRVSLAARLTAEKNRVAYESSRDQMMDKVGAFRESVVTNDHPKIDPPLTTDQWKALNERIERAWESLFVPPPPDVAPFLRHGYLGADLRADVERRLKDVAQLTTGTIESALQRKAVAETKIRQLREQKKSLTEGTKGYEMSEKLKELSAEYTTASNRVNEIGRLLTADESMLLHRQQERGRLEAAAGKGNNELLVAQKCDLVSETLDAFIEDLRSRRTGQLATKMTEVYRRLARKEDVVKEIKISPDGAVELIGKSGRDLGEQDLSAGENQIFALSLVSAASGISNAEIPVVIDTPLARLDGSHRQNVLKEYLPTAAKQVIVLSTDEEIVGDRYKSIKGLVGATFLVEFDEATEMSTVTSGYFGKAK